MITKCHHFFLLQSNPWAIMVSLGCFNSFFTFLMFLKFQSLYSFISSVSILAALSLAWWIGYSSEFVLSGSQSNSLVEGVKLGMLLFISSEVFFFFSFFWSYFHYFLAPCMESGLHWPPLMVEMFDFSNVPLINTLVLLISGVTVTISHHFMDKGMFSWSHFYLVTTAVLGVLFTILQLMEYQSSFFSISDGSFGTAFFVLTGFHGLHVLIGTLFLLVSFSRSSILSSTVSEYTSIEMASWYWHFVDVVWIFLFFFLYYMNS